MPHGLHLLVHEVGQPRVDVPRRHAVDAGEVAPLVRERLGQVDAARLGDVVRRLLLREVGDVPAHRGGDDEGARAALAEVEARGAGAVEGAGQVGADDVVPGGDGGVEDAGVGGAARVGDEDVDAAEVADHVGDELLDVGVVAHVALVGFGFGAVLILELLGVLDAAFGAGGVGDGDVGAHFGAAPGGFGADAGGAGGAGHDDDFAFEAEELLKGVGFGGFDGHDGGWWEVGRGRWVLVGSVWGVDGGCGWSIDCVWCKVEVRAWRFDRCCFLRVMKRRIIREGKSSLSRREK